MGAPKGPNRARIKQDADLEAERIKFENERRLFIEHAASNELVTTAAQERLASGSSFEYSDPNAVDPNDFGAAGLMIPSKFDPSIDFSKYNLHKSPDLSWATAENLGFDPNAAMDWGGWIDNPQGGRNRPGRLLSFWERKNKDQASTGYIPTVQEMQQTWNRYEHGHSGLTNWTNFFAYGDLAPFTGGRR